MSAAQARPVANSQRWVRGLAPQTCHGTSPPEAALRPYSGGLVLGLLPIVVGKLYYLLTRLRRASAIP